VAIEFTVLSRLILTRGTVGTPPRPVRPGIGGPGPRTNARRVSKPFRDALILQQTHRTAEIDVADHAREYFFGMALRIAGDPKRRLLRLRNLGYSADIRRSGLHLPTLLFLVSGAAQRYGHWYRFRGTTGVVGIRPLPPRSPAGVGGVPAG
jgi:hypothetical protein